MLSIADQMPDYVKQMLDSGWAIVLYPAYLDSEEGYMAIGCDVPVIFDGAIEGTGITPVLALKNLMENIKKDLQDNSDIDLRDNNEESQENNE